MPSSPTKAAGTTTLHTSSSRLLHISTPSTPHHTRAPLDDDKAAASSTPRRGMGPQPTVELPLRHKAEPSRTKMTSSSSSLSRSSSYIDGGRSDDKSYKSSERTSLRADEESSADTHYLSSTDTTVSKPLLKSFTPDPESPIAGPSRSRSRSPSPSLDDADDAPTLASSPTKKKRSGGRRRNKTDTPPPQFIDHLPTAEAAAMQTFEELPRNWYQNGKLGRSRGQEEGMVCECRYSFDRDPASAACGEDSGCINRLTQVECMASQCSCKEHCQNQRFQRAQYADIEIVQTDKKGFGLRAGSAYTADTFIYEYVGEVLDHKTFMKRMQAYAEEGIRHFYFMMLQREEYLDATKKGGKARFMNHSCSPNCFVAKWHVGKHMRMGIFAQRDIAKGEELTFNYNVDRYGHDAQECYCGEPNCVGTLGGKTQTDIGGMDQLFIDALGITEEVDELEAKGTRKKKSRHLDEDFTPTLRPIEEHEVAKVITAVRQAMSNRLILDKLLQRIHMTNTVSVQKALVRLHGFVLMAGVIDEWRDDKVVLMLVLGSLARWPLIARNKVVDAGVDQLVRDLTTHADAEISALAQDLLNAWEALEMSYRIARRDAAADGDNSEAAAPAWLDAHRAREADEMTLDKARAPNSIMESLSRIAIPLGLGKASLPRQPGTPDSLRPPKPKRTPSAMIVPAPTPPPPPPKTQSIEEIIRRANESQALQRKQAEEQARLEREEAKAREKERRARKRSAKERGGSDKRRKGSSSGDGKGASSSSSSGLSSLEKRLRKLVGELVVKCMSMHKDRLDREVFKKHARDLTDIICRKEMKTSAWPPKDGKLEALTSDKKKRMKPLAEEYVAKLVARKGKPITSASAGGSNGASNGHRRGSNGAHARSPDDGPPLDEDDDEDDDDAMSLSSSQSGEVEDTPRTASLDADVKGADSKYFGGEAPPPTESPPPPPPPELPVPVIYTGPPPASSISESSLYASAPPTAPLTPLMPMSPPPPPMPMSMASPSPMPMQMASSPPPMLVAYPGPPPPRPPPGPPPAFYSGPPPGY